MAGEGSRREGSREEGKSSPGGFSDSDQRVDGFLVQVGRQLGTKLALKSEKMGYRKVLQKLVKT